MSYKTYFDTSEIRVCCTCRSSPILPFCADARARRCIATFSRNRTCEPSIHSTWSACPSRRQGSGSRSRSVRASSVPVSARRVMPTPKSDYGAGSGSHATPTRDITRLFFTISPLSVHVRADPPRVRRPHPAFCLLICTWTCACLHPRPYSCTAPLPCVIPKPSGRHQRSRADGARALGTHGRALSKHPQQRPSV